MRTLSQNPNPSQPSEIQIQSHAFQTAWNEFPETRRLIFHVPNGGARNVIEASQLKASGVVPGIPDILLLWNGRTYGFEFKTSTGVVSKDQVKVHEVWKANGIDVYIVRDAEAFINHIQRITGLIPLSQRNTPLTSAAV